MLKKLFILFISVLVFFGSVGLVASQSSIIVDKLSAKISTMFDGDKQKQLDLWTVVIKKLDKVAERNDLTEKQKNLYLSIKEEMENRQVETFKEMFEEKVDKIYNEEKETEKVVKTLYKGIYGPYKKQGDSLFYCDKITYGDFQYFNIEVCEKENKWKDITKYIDINTWEYLGDSYSKDKNNFYERANVIFTKQYCLEKYMLENAFDSIKYLGFGYFSYKNFVFTRNGVFGLLQPVYVKKGVYDWQNSWGNDYYLEADSFKVVSLGKRDLGTDWRENVIDKNQQFYSYFNAVNKGLSFVLEDRNGTYGQHNDGAFVLEKKNTFVEERELPYLSVCSKFGNFY